MGRFFHAQNLPTGVKRIRPKGEFFMEEENKEVTTDLVPDTDNGADKGGNREEVIFNAEQQAYVDKLVSKAKYEAKERLKSTVPPKEELDAFNAWKDSQKTEAEKQAQLLKDFESLKSKNNNLEIKTRLLEEGIPKDLVKYAMLDIQEADGDIDAGIANFKASDIFKAKQQVLNLGVKSQISATPKSEEAKLKTAYDEAVKAGDRTSAISIKRQAAQQGINI